MLMHTQKPQEGDNSKRSDLALQTSCFEADGACFYSVVS